MQLKVFADYFQIHVLDEGSETELDDAWNEQTLSDRIVAVHDILGIRTEVNVDVDVDLVWHASPPRLEAEAFDHVAEASIEIPSGRMVVMGCTDYLPEAPRFDVTPGLVRIRVQKSNLRAATLADIDSDQSTETIERIRIDTWPAAAPSGPDVVKRWASD